MKTMIIGKWKWIAKACENLKLDEEAEIAWEIDGVLRELYGTTLADSWIEDWYGGRIDDYEDATLDDVIDMAGSLKYCIACEETRDCFNCRFASHYGVDDCTRDPCSYFKFQRVIWRR